jgi:hypothetical protein
MGTSKLSEAVSPKDPALRKLIIRALDPSTNHNRPLPNSSRGSRNIESKVLFLRLGSLPSSLISLFAVDFDGLFRVDNRFYFLKLVWNAPWVQATGDFLELNDLRYKYFLK